jgi:3-oxoacid CoA-transferase B subunit
MSAKQMIAKRAAKEVRTGQVINLGIGIPTLIPRYLSPSQAAWIQSENGILGMGNRAQAGQEQRNLIDAGGNYVQVLPGAAFFDSVLSFSIIRGGRLDIAFLGALEVSARGDLANWIVPGKYSPGIGGGMELAQKARRVIVTTTHTTRSGAPKIVSRCSLPLTAKGCVETIITELAVIRITPAGLLLKEIGPATSVEEVLTRTAADLIVPDAGPARYEP